MKIITLGMGQNIYDESSAVRERMIEYGRLFEELHVVVFTPYHDKFQNQKLSENVFLYPTKSKKRILYIFDFLKIVKDILKKDGKNERENDFVISVQDPFETGIVGLILKLFYRLPLQIQVHTDFINKYFITHTILNFVRFPLGLFTLSFADSVRVVSEKIEKSIHSLSHNISVLPIFVEKSEVGIMNNESSKDSNKIRFLTICRLEKEKDLKTALLAFKKFLETEQNAEFVIVGEGSERKNLQNLCKDLQIEEKVKFEGWQNDLSSYYKEASVYISTSLYEGYGMSVVEAASNGLPLILTDAGVAKEYFKDNGALVCTPKDQESILNAMLVLLDKDKREEMGRLAKRSIERELISKEDYLKKYEASLKQAQNFNNLKLGMFRKNLLLRYLVAGLSGASLNIFILYACTRFLNLWYLYSTVIAFLVAIVLSFILQKFWTFADRDTKQIGGQFSKYVVVGFFGILINTICMYLLVDLMGIWYILAQIITNVFIAVFNFLMYKFVIFHKK